MKKILLLLTLITFSAFAQNPNPNRFGISTKFVQPDTLSTAQRTALNPKLGTLIYHKDTGVSQWEQWDGDSWEELGGDGAVSSVNFKIGDVVVDPDDLDDSSTTNKFVTEEEKELIATALQDAPSDGNEYVRKDGDWEVATSGGENIYNSDGTLEGDRSIDLDGHSFNIGGTVPNLTVNDTMVNAYVLDGTKIRGFTTSAIESEEKYVGISNRDLSTSKEASITLHNTDSTLIRLRAEKFIFDVDGTTPDTGDVLTLQPDGTTKFQAPSGGGGGATNAENVIVSPSIGGNTDAYAVMEANRTSIDSIQANMSSGINTALRTVTSTAGVFTEAFNEAHPNLQLLISEDTELTITSAINGNFVILEVYNSHVSNDYTLNLNGTNEDLFTTIYHGERAYFTMTTNPDDEILWLRSYPDGKTNKVISITGTGGTTIDWSKSPYYNFIHGAMNDTLVFVAPKSSKKLRLTRTQDATGSRTVAYGSTLFASGGTLPTLTTTANATDVIHLFYDKENDRYSIEDVELNIQSIAGTPPEPQLTQISTSGATFGSSGTGASPASNSFDNNIATHSSTTFTSLGWISVDFGSAVSVQKVEILPRQSSTDGTRLNGVQLRWSNDGTTWTDIGTPVSGVDSGNYTNWVTITFAAQSARYWGWINSVAGTYSGNVAEIKFFGL